MTFVVGDAFSLAVTLLSLVALDLVEADRLHFLFVMWSDVFT